MRMPSSPPPSWVASTVNESAQVKVVVKSVKERELPEADDDFAQLASEFDTLAELREDLAKQAAESKVVEQGVEARDKVLDKLVELVAVPVPASVVEEQIEQHFNAENAHGEGDHDTEEHRAEVKANTERAFQNEIILDAIAEKEEVNVSQNELIDYIVTTASTSTAWTRTSSPRSSIRAARSP